ncbi:MAG TPA: P1 family peptidase [Candidatus Acidoferrales bacterium]|nr:P1 family peptidase [Candidatus Acidoferrales bacterium]
MADGAARETGRPRARDLGIVIGEGRPGPANAITDVLGVRVGHTTLIRGDGPLVVGRGPVRTGVTVVVPHDGDAWAEPVFAGSFTLNGNGELTGLEWIRDAGLLHGPIGLTNTRSVGTVRDALAAQGHRSHPPGAAYWALPVAGETWDGALNDIAGAHVTPEHVDEALAAAMASPLGAPVAEGNVGGGTGMVCHEFKGGIGTSSRVVPDDLGGWTVGVLVQANYGRRGLLRVDGVAVGEAIGVDEVPSPYPGRRRGIGPAPDTGSIIGIVATDAPLLPHQCQRLARRMSLGVARVGGLGGTGSGDLFLAFATGNRGLPAAEDRAVAVPGERPGVVAIRALADTALDPLFEATVEATEESIVNALVAAETMTGRDGTTAHRLPHDRLVEVMRAAGRR